MPTGVKIRGKMYSERTTHEKKSTAQEKAGVLRRKGYLAVVRKARKSRFTGRSMWTVYARFKGK